jgi:uncharacterized protein (DUF2249 family)
MEQKLTITPKTKILDLITDYPELEEILFDISPAFKQLKNPILRRTVARVTTIQQAALVGNIKVEDLVNKLRIASGTSGIPDSSADGPDQSPSSVTRPNYVEADNNPPGQKIPAWFSKDKVTVQLDAREMLNRGEHPVGQVLADLHKLPEAEIYLLIAPFYPAPLIDKATGIGFEYYVTEITSEEFHIYFALSLHHDNSSDN